MNSKRRRKRKAAEILEKSENSNENPGISTESAEKSPVTSTERSGVVNSTAADQASHSKSKEQKKRKRKKKNKTDNIPDDRLAAYGLDAKDFKKQHLYANMELKHSLE